MLPVGAFLRHSNCPHCPSSDAYSVYSNGSAYCYACGTYDDKAYGSMKKRDTKKLIPVGDYKQLKARKLSAQVCERYNYGISSYKGNRVQVAPYYRNRKMVAQHLRTQDKKFIWLGDTGGIELFGQHAWAAGGKQLVITEGEIDCMSIAQALGLKWPCVSIPSGAQSAFKFMSEQIEYINSFQKVILAFDNDKDGKEAIDKVIPLITPGKAKVLQYPAGMKDANDFLKDGKGSELLQAIWNAPEYRPDGIVSGSDLLEELFKDDTAGLSSPYPLLDLKFHGWRKGELYLFTAGSGIGKSTLVKEIGYHFLMEHDQGIGIIALEENKRRTLQDMVGIHLNKPLHMSKKGITNEQLENSFKAVMRPGKFYLYDHWGSTSIDNLMAKIRYLAVGCKVDWIILDHISIVVSGLTETKDNNERQMIDQLMTRLRSLIEETQIGVLAIVHLKRPQGQGKSFNEGRQVSLTDLRGSGGLEQLSDGVIALERDQQGANPDLSTIRVLKNRPIGLVGSADTLEYQHLTGRLLPAGEDTKLEKEDF